MSLLTNFQDLATAIKLALDRKADISKVNSDISRVESSISSVGAELSEVHSGLNAISSPLIIECVLTEASIAGNPNTAMLQGGYTTANIKNAVDLNREVYLLIANSPDFYQFEGYYFVLDSIDSDSNAAVPGFKFKCLTPISMQFRTILIHEIVLNGTNNENGVSNGLYYRFNLSGDYDHIINAPNRSDIDANTAARHTHENKAVLDKFSEVGGGIKYDGKDISGAFAVTIEKSNGSYINDKELSEIYDAWDSTGIVYVRIVDEDGVAIGLITDASRVESLSSGLTSYSFSGNATVHSNEGNDATVIDFDYSITALGIWTVNKQNVKGLVSINSELYPKNIADGVTVTDGKAIKYSDGTLNTSSLSYTDYVNVSGISEIIYPRILSTSTSSSFIIGMAFYDSGKTYISGQVALKNQAQFGFSMTRISVPANAVWARFTWSSSLQSIMVYDSSHYDHIIPNRLDRLEAREQYYPLGLHTMPENEGVLNVIKRCRQMTDIKWTPAVDLPRLMMVQRSYPIPNTATDEEYEGVFKAGVEYTGIPYGRANDITSYGYDYGFVGKYINFDTFVSAVSNANSIVSKESSFSLTDHESVVYAAVCSALTCYALNVAYYPTASIPSIQGLNAVGKINNNGTLLDPSNFKLGDILNLTSYHTAIITDIIKDSSGNVKIIELADASTAGLADKNYDDGELGGVCRRKGWTIEQIYNSWGAYTLMRYANIAGVTYTPSPYVNVGDEPDMFRTIHYPCMPYMGEGFTYKSGYIPNTYIVIAPNLGYSYLRVFKDGTEMASSPFEVTASTDKIAVGFSDTGDYEAYLCNMSNGDDTAVSYKCHWSVE